jgi:acetyl esterase
MALHPKLAEMLQMAKASGKPAFHECTPEQARNVMATSAAALGAGPELHDTRDLKVPTRAGQIDARLYRSGAQETGLIVYLHGGGWCVGSIDGFDALARMLCHDSGCAVLLIDYRLAPEHPFPAGLEDSIDAIQWAWRERATLAGAEVPLVVAGDSAGGNLAAVCVNELANEIPFAAQLLIYPVTDCDFDTESYQQFSDGYPLMRQDMEWFFNHYAPKEQWAHQLISPLKHKAVAGLPSTWVAVADHDVLRDDGLRYAQALKDHGTDVHLNVYPGMAHGFIRMGNLIDVARQAVTDLARAAHQSCRQAAK